VGVLKAIGYLIAAVAVLTVLAMGGMLIVVIGLVVGAIGSLIGTTVFTAYGLKNYFDSNKKRSDLD